MSELYGQGGFWEGGELGNACMRQAYRRGCTVFWPWSLADCHTVRFGRVGKNLASSCVVLVLVLVLCPYCIVLYCWLCTVGCGLGCVLKVADRIWYNGAICLYYIVPIIWVVSIGWLLFPNTFLFLFFFFFNFFSSFLFVYCWCTVVVI